MNELILLQQAAQFYESLGYTYIKVPWIVSSAICLATMPEGGTLKATEEGKALTASGEQGFLKLAILGALEPNKKYYTVTPCFRDENITKHSTNEFYKLELFVYKNENNNILQDAYRFYNKYFDKYCLNLFITDKGYDISVRKNTKEYELASYYANKLTIMEHELIYDCCTGVAPYRMLSVLESKAHDLPIPKGDLNSKEKITEEYYEFLDAVKQESTILQLIELADLTNSINDYVRNTLKVDPLELQHFNNYVKKIKTRI